MAAALTRKVARRSSMRNHFSKVLKEAHDYLNEEDVLEARLISFESKLKKSCANLEGIDEEICNSLEAEKIREDVKESLELLDPLDEVLASITIRLNSLKLAIDREDNSALNASIGSSNSSSAPRCHLPKLEIPIFEGDPLEWQGFWDHFNVSFHSNEHISEVDKFSYLKTLLSGKALAVVKGFVLSTENYKEALGLLKERFGNPQVLISAHLDALIKIRKIKNDDDFEGMRKLYHEVETCVRNLRSLEVETKTYGCLLILLLKDKLPEQILMEISRGMAGNIWTLEEFLKGLNRESQAKESFVGCQQKVEKKSKGEFMASGFHVQGRNLECVYCLGKHSSSYCEKVSDVNARRNILKKYSRCFVYLNSFKLLFFLSLPKVRWR